VLNSDYLNLPCPTLNHWIMFECLEVQFPNMGEQTAKYDIIKL